MDRLHHWLTSSLLPAVVLAWIAIIIAALTGAILVLRRYNTGTILRRDALETKRRHWALD